MGEVLLSLLWLVVCCAVVLGLAYWFTKHVVGRGRLGSLGIGGGTENLRVLDQLSLGKDQRLLVVCAGDRFLLLGVTASGISTLAELTPEEAEAWLAREKTQLEQSPPSFTEALQKVLKQKVGGENRWPKD